ncbi:hypothetical protein [Peptoniphilus indolicus]|uniref:Uncharacterized protein n=2 Tax=Peptoniphilus indolicus TaxID=33030 RepID=G4D5E3_9FIRM|nr:hypothetical protein [Peptoniphilus indolicus]EGY78989.1 hypothetical protein HMPREF9129_1623 [Peptoniphilus indolicus ATCC 29427]SUB74359.1 Uncharacterised protein [Peptoniphilus indolicus]
MNKNESLAILKEAEEFFRNIYKDETKRKELSKKIDDFLGENSLTYNDDFRSRFELVGNYPIDKELKYNEINYNNLKDYEINSLNNTYKGKEDLELKNNFYTNSEQLWMVA